jgi:CYTH domain-containing protein
METTRQTTRTTEHWREFVESELAKRKEYSETVDKLTQEIRATMQQIPESLRSILANIRDEFKHDLLEPLKESKALVTQHNRHLIQLGQVCIDFLSFIDHADHASILTRQAWLKRRFVFRG